MTSVQEFFDNNLRLPSPPAIALKILEAVREEKNSFDDLAQIVSVDPSLSIRILQIANSSLYGLAQPVDSLAQATSLLGTDALKNIALSFVIVQEFQGESEGSFDLTLFWRRAITAAVAAEMLGDAVGVKSRSAFVSALLQDVGILIFFLSDAFDYTRVLDSKRVSGKSTCETEKELFAFDHTEIGFHLLTAWNLPEMISAPIHFHHSVENAGEYQQDARLLYFADKISAMYHSEHSNAKSVEVHSGLAEHWNLSGEDVDTLVDAVGEKSQEVLELFAIDPGEIQPFSQIIQAANIELGRLNFSYEQLVLELKQAKESADKLAKELKDANDCLREIAVRDGLTNLYNHRYFQERLEIELKRAYRYRHPVSLLMLDIDFFKTVNDTYGHPTGDHALKTVSYELVKLVRDCDIVCRYGGEEFAVILPETGAKGAKVLAQRLRRGIEQKSMEYEGHAFKITVSVGYSATDMSGAESSRAALIRYSDSALCQSKQKGRNRVEAARI